MGVSNALPIIGPDFITLSSTQQQEQGSSESRTRSGVGLSLSLTHTRVESGSKFAALHAVDAVGLKLQGKNCGRAGGQSVPAG